MNLTNPQFTKTADMSGYHVSHACECGHVTKGDILAHDLFKWRQGATPQVAFPYLSDTQREALFVTGTCGFCWNAMFADDEQEDENYEDDYDEGYSQSGAEYMANYLNSDSNIAYLNG